MTKSVVILAAMIWLLCSLYYALAIMYNYPYRTYAMAGTWAASILLLAALVVFIKKQSR